MKRYNPFNPTVLLSAALIVVASVLPVSSQDPLPAEEGLRHAFPGQQHYSPYAGRNFPNRVY